MKRNVRDTLGYKVRMWFYRLTWEDIVKTFTNTRSIIIDVITYIVINTFDCLLVARLHSLPSKHIFYDFNIFSACVKQLFTQIKSFPERR